MHVTRIDEHIHLVDLEIVGIKDFIASYILTDRNSNVRAIVETGPASTVQNLLAALTELDVEPEEVAYVAVSHIHLDHSGGAGILLKHLPKARLIVHPRGAPHLANPEKLWAQSKEALGKIAEKYGKPEPVPKEKIIVATKGMSFTIGDEVELKAVETLGHASHHIAYYEKLSHGIFTGDAAGIYLNKHDVVVPTTPWLFRLDIALTSLEKLIKLNPKALYYSHFGKAHNAIDKLESYSKQLELWADTAKQGIEEGEKLETISKRILESDKALRKVSKYIKKHLILSQTVLYQSVEGVMKFVEKFGAPLE